MTPEEKTARKSFAQAKVMCWCGHCLDWRRLVRVTMFTPSNVHRSWACSTTCESLTRLPYAVTTVTGPYAVEVTPVAVGPQYVRMTDEHTADAWGVYVRPESDGLAVHVRDYPTRQLAETAAAVWEYHCED